MAGQMKTVNKKVTGQSLLGANGFIANLYERKICMALNKLSLTTLTKNKPTSKEIAVLKGEMPICYISRKTGLSKGLLKVVIKPKAAIHFDHILAEFPYITQSPGRTSRFISSSQYELFRNAGTIPEIESNEHVGAAYNVEYDSELFNLISLINKLINQNSLS